ncbi:TPA: cupredoxin domain-containing protein [Bacillus cereus]|uniref:cupredoxin domain-containing protein n=1 Tax=Bacillus cereus group TaxID=86661 RepID=UPI00192699E6|nr:cupredoxin domain-containing protein [Bacillus cereus]MBL3878151.1 cupredoxin domain-containing protein [Bacillus cereus]HDR7981508.1 cupredoxin domain-containing protein [Bacillus cereus]HDR8059651.1 cupredoxin domain-containing protein [Bacillus cereus]HDR8077551.1 cupredoxin domain-containing protein [Bacillus cereus]HDR8208421.1 cupredoxin domain-containing protein [Bacillus cereus]
MSVKKWLTGLVALLVMIVVVTTSGSLSVFAESGVVTRPIDSVKVIEVELNDDYFNPNGITIPIGRTTKLILKNQGNKEHTFIVKKLSIDTKVQPRKEKNITVKPNKPGTYELICRYHFQITFIHSS